MENDILKEKTFTQGRENAPQENEKSEKKYNPNRETD
jgi:hypothetical protein